MKDYSLVVRRRPNHSFHLCSSQLALYRENSVLVTEGDINNEVSEDI